MIGALELENKPLYSRVKPRTPHKFMDKGP